MCRKYETPANGLWMSEMTDMLTLPKDDKRRGRRVKLPTEDAGGGASRTTQEAAGTSSGTDVSLREYLTQLINAVENRADERFEAMKVMVDTAFVNSQLAIDKSDAATEKRFEGVNEFRAQLTDQAATFASKENMEALGDKLILMIDRNRHDLDVLAKRIDLREGQSIGSRITFGVLVTVVTVGIGIIGLVFVLVNTLTNP